MTSHSASHRRLPLPMATGGIGLLVAYSLPGGLSGGDGFLIGLTIGAGILGVAAFLASRVVPIEQPERVSS
jgi:hypothetical protein